MIELRITCCQCGRELRVPLYVSEAAELKPEKLKSRIKQADADWVVQFNGPNFDTYCCKECAQ